MYNLYSGKTDDEMPNYDIIIPPSSHTNKDNSFYMILWSGKGTVKKATKESYMKGQYTLSDNILTIKTPVENRDEYGSIVSKIQSSLPINVVNVTETKISGDFRFRNIKNLW